MKRGPPVLLACVVLDLSACGRSTVQEPEPHEAPPMAPNHVAPALSPRLSRPAPDRLVAIGDLHGDLDHARRALLLAGAIDEHDQWVGGRLVVVQTGDEIDRGDDDRAILDHEGSGFREVGRSRQRRRGRRGDRLRGGAPIHRGPKGQRR